MTGFVVFGHGSSVASANDSVFAVEKTFAGRGFLTETAFLECPPTLAQAVRGLVRRGASRVVILPYFLTLGIHLQRDLPKIVDALRAEHTGVEFRVAPPLDGHPALAQILEQRALEAEA